MKVTPVNKKFGKYKPGDVFDFPDKPAKVFIKIGKLSAVVDAPPLTQASQTYSTRMMQAKTTIGDDGFHTPNPGAPYGYKADGTPRKRPGRQAASHD